MLIPQERSFIETIFACIDDGVITINDTNIITFCNATAGRLLNINPSIVTGQHYQEAFNSFPQLGLIGRLHALRMQQQTGCVVRTLIAGNVPGRGQVQMNLSVGLVTDLCLNYLGMVMILDNNREGILA
jgi:PAS domain-containing protein